jgi:hypothetical protein
VYVPRVFELGLIAVLVLALAPGSALAQDEADEPADTGQPAKADKDEGPVNPYEQIEGDPGLWTHGWVALALGGAMLIAGGVTGGLALKLNGDLEDKCSGGQCPPGQHDELDRRDALATSSTALIAAGFASAMVGLLVLAAFAPDRAEEAASANKDTEVALLPLIDPELAGAAVTWRF